MLFCRSHLTWHDAFHCGEGYGKNATVEANLALVEVFNTWLAVCVWVRGRGPDCPSLDCGLKRQMLNPNSLRWWVSVTKGSVAEAYLWQPWLWTTGWKLINILVLTVCLGIEYREIRACSTEALSSAADLRHLQRRFSVLVNGNRVFPRCFQICCPVSNCPTLPNFNCM